MGLGQEPGDSADDEDNEIGAAERGSRPRCGEEQ